MNYKNGEQRSSLAAHLDAFQTSRPWDVGIMLQFDLVYNHQPPTDNIDDEGSRSFLCFVFFFFLLRCLNVVDESCQSA